MARRSRAEPTEYQCTGLRTTFQLFQLSVYGQKSAGCQSSCDVGGPSAGSGHMSERNLLLTLLIRPVPSFKSTRVLMETKEYNVATFGNRGPRRCWEDVQCRQTKNLGFCWFVWWYLASRSTRDGAPSCFRTFVRNAKQGGTRCGVNEDPREEDVSVNEDHVSDEPEQRNDRDGDVSARGACNAGWRA